MPSRSIVASKSSDFSGAMPGSLTVSGYRSQRFVFHAAQDTRAKISLPKVKSCVFTVGKCGRTLSSASSRRSLVLPPPSSVPDKDSFHAKPEKTYSFNSASETRALLKTNIILQPFFSGAHLGQNMVRTVHASVGKVAESPSMANKDAKRGNLEPVVSSTWKYVTFVPLLRGDGVEWHMLW